MPVSRTWAVAAAGVMTYAALAACGADAATRSVADKAQSENKLVFGVRYDQPGLGLKRPNGSLAGLDIDVATFIARELGVTDPKNITWTETRAANRESFLKQGQVDLVVANYSITPERKTKVRFAGPYFVAHQDILVRAGDVYVRGPKDLTGRRLCTVSGSVSAGRVTEEQGVRVKLQEVGGWQECITRLLGKQVDAVSSDDAVLAGFAAQRPGTMRIVGNGFSDERYGIGLRLSDTKGCRAVNDALRKMFAEGAAQRFVQANLGRGLNAIQPAFEDCG